MVTDMSILEGALAVPEVSQPQHNSEDIVTVVSTTPYTHKVYGDFIQWQPRYISKNIADELVEIEDGSGNAIFKQL